MRTTVNWNEVLYDEFVRIAMLSPFYADVLRLRIMEHTISEIAEIENCDERTISRAVAYLREKYDSVQPYSDKLPKRRTSEKEIYMDSH